MRGFRYGRTSRIERERVSLGAFSAEMLLDRCLRNVSTIERRMAKEKKTKQRGNG